MSTGNIFDIQRFSIHDGPGIRTTVFMKGCPLRCLWCGNPESINPQPQLSYQYEQCIACGECLKVCGPSAISVFAEGLGFSARGMNEAVASFFAKATQDKTADSAEKLRASSEEASGKVVVDRACCTNCGLCAPVCDSKALEMVGRDMEVDKVMEVVLRDRDYYEKSGGGMTLSGGEPLLQPKFAESLVRAAKKQGIHCCVETAGYADWEAFERLRSVVDLWLFDFKETDSDLHVKFTGQGNQSILERLTQLHDAGEKVLLRCPMIPGYNARKQHLDGIVALAGRLPKLEGVELLPYYDLWRAKLKRFGLVTDLPDSVKPPLRETVKSWNDYLRERGVKVVG